MWEEVTVLSSLVLLILSSWLMETSSSPLSVQTGDGRAAELLLVNLGECGFQGSGDSDANYIVSLADLAHPPEICTEGR